LAGRGRLEDPHKRLRAVLCARCTVLHIIGKTIHGTISVFCRLELNNLVASTPFLDLDDLGLVLLGEKILYLVVALRVHDKETDDVVRRVLGRWGGRICTCRSISSGGG